MFSICTAIIETGKIEETLDQWKGSASVFTREIGVFDRFFFQCEFQPHLVWSLTGWESEKHHNDAAQSIMKIRRDDRIASSPFDKPYFEVFCEQDELSFGAMTKECGLVVVVHGLIGATVEKEYYELRRKRIAEFKGKFPWLGLFFNTYHPSEFTAYLGFPDKAAYEALRKVEEMTLEEYLFSGLRTPMGMSLIAGYNQFVCRPILTKW
jgi:heme-degrading monooxygenase HmoA